MASEKIKLILFVLLLPLLSTAKVEVKRVLAASNGACNGSIEVVMTGDKGPYTLNLQGISNQEVNNVDGSYTFQNLCSGSYTLDVSGAGTGGCMSTFNIFVDDVTCSAIDILLVKSSDATDCETEDGYVGFEINNQNKGVAFEYEVSNGQSGNSKGGDYLYTPINYLAKGDYSITVVDDNGCSSVFPFSIGPSSCETICPPEFGVNLIEKRDISCNGAFDGFLEVDGNNGAEPYSFLWDTGEITARIEFKPAGDYEVTVTDANNCTAISTFIIGTLAEPSVTAQITNTTCGQDNGAISITVSGHPSFSYFYNWTHIESGTTYSDEDLVNIPIGNYELLLSYGDKCEITTSFAVSDGGGLNITPTLSPPTLCDQLNGSISIEISGGVPPYNIDWLHVEGSDDGDIADGLGVGVYTVVVTDANDCVEETSIDLVHPSSDFRATFEAVGTDCQGLNGAIDITITGGTPPYRYYFDKPIPGSPFGTVEIFGPTSNTSHRFENVFRGLHKVFVRDDNECRYESTVKVDNAEDLLQLQSIMGVEPDCNTSNGSITINTSNGVLPITYEISDGDQFDQTISSNSESYTFSNLVAATYDIIVTDQSGCTSNRTYRLDNDSDLSVTASVKSAYCGDNGEVNLTITGGTEPYQVDWQHISGEDNPEDLVMLPRGTYIANVTDADGCNKEISVDIFEGNNLSANFYANEANCAGQNGGIYFEVTNGTSPYTYSWRPSLGSWQSGSSNQPTYTADGLSSGTYEAKVTDADGCVRSQSVTIERESGPSISYGQVTNNCSSGGGTINTDVSGGTSPYTYSWTNITTGQVVPNSSNMQNLTITNISAKYVYKVTVADNEGCTDTPSDGRTLFEKLTIKPDCNWRSGIQKYELHAMREGGSSDIDYNWNGPDNNLENMQIVKTTIPGTYMVTVTDNVTGCPQVTGSTTCSGGGSSQANDLSQKPDANKGPVVNIYPNPFDNFLQIEINTEQEQPLEIEILDLVGRVIYRQSIDTDIGLNKLTIDMEATNTTSGLYQVLVKGKDTAPQNFKVVRMRQ